MKDKVISELHKIREDLAEASNYDVRTLLESSRKVQEGTGKQAVILGRTRKRSEEGKTKKVA